MVGLVAVERLVELTITRRHLRHLLTRDALVAGREHYPWMVALHAAFLVAAPFEVRMMERPFLPPLAVAMTVIVALTMTLRYWVIVTLGERWTTQIVVVPGAPPITGGPYRFLRHPNYVAVTLEVAALPLVHTAWLTALAFSIGNFFILRRRVRSEEEALATHSPYLEHLGEKPRFFPQREEP